MTGVRRHFHHCATLVDDAKHNEVTIQNGRRFYHNSSQCVVDLLAMCGHTMVYLRRRSHLPRLSTSKHAVSLQLSLLPLLLEKRPFLGQARLRIYGRNTPRNASVYLLVLKDELSRKWMLRRRRDNLPSSYRGTICPCSCFRTKADPAAQNGSKHNATPCWGLSMGMAVVSP